jgi:hypothetical protein
MALTTSDDDIFVEEGIQEYDLKNDRAWQLVFERTDLLKSIDETGYFLISAKELQSSSDERQPRLMVKFDFNFQRPQLFKKHQLNILPLKRGNYVVFRDPKNICYFVFDRAEEPGRPISFKPVADIEAYDTLERELCSTECDAVDLAHASGLLQFYCGTGPLTLTKRGRFGSGKFVVRIPGCGEEIPVEGAQIEVDSVYESEDAVVLIEAKRGFHEEFHTRQLYYPYQWLQQKTRKKIVPIFLCYSNGKYQINQFEIGTEFGDMKLVRQEYFVIGKYAVAAGDLDSMVATSAEPEESKVAFPQADDVDKIVDVVSLVEAGIKDKPSLMDVFGFTERQATYYLTAARYLGFLSSTDDLTPVGERLMSVPNQSERSKLILDCMFSRPALRNAILYFKAIDFDHHRISRHDIIAMIEFARPKEYALSTLLRRADCVRTWLRWLRVNCDLR